MDGAEGGVPGGESVGLPSSPAQGACRPGGGLYVLAPTPRSQPPGKTSGAQEGNGDFSSFVCCISRST